MEKQANPLLPHFRQTAIYIDLPSAGEYWPAESLLLSATGELAIMPMTTRDEITIKTPDTLMNGQAVVDVIQSCCSGVVDAWNTPSIDVDSILIAIRIASYGNEMEFESTCVHCKESNEYTIDLSQVLASVVKPNYSNTFDYKTLSFKFKPQPYSVVNKASKVAFEEHQILVSLTELPKDTPTEEIANVFNSQVDKLVEFNASMLTASTEHIVTNGTKVTDPEFIQQFYINSDSTTVKKVREYIAELNKSAELDPVVVECNQCKKDFKIAITFDYSSFFAQDS